MEEEELLFKFYDPNIKEEKDPKKTFEEFIKVLGEYFNPDNNNIFVPAFTSTTSTTPEDLLNRFNVLKFLEKKRRLIQGNEYYSLDTTYSIKQSYISQIFRDRSAPGPGTTFLGELDLRDEVLKNLREEYKRSLTGKMFEVLDSLKDSVQSMNRYFATTEPYIANETVGNLNNTTNKFSNYFLKKEEI